MTVYAATGDLCATPNCHDLAHPGHDHCIGCIADRQAERQITEEQAAVLTAAHEAHVLGEYPGGEAA